MSGRPLEIQDARLAELQPLALLGHTDPRPLLSVRDILGSVADDPRLRQQLQVALRDLERGLEPAIQRRLSQAGHPVPRSTLRPRHLETHSELVLQ